MELSNTEATKKNSKPQDKYWQKQNEHIIIFTDHPEALLTPHPNTNISNPLWRLIIDCIDNLGPSKPSQRAAALENGLSRGALRLGRSSRVTQPQGARQLTAGRSSQHNSSLVTSTGGQGATRWGESRSLNLCRATKIRCEPRFNTIFSTSSDCS